MMERTDNLYYESPISDIQHQLFDNRSALQATSRCGEEELRRCGNVVAPLHGWLVNRVSLPR